MALPAGLLVAGYGLKAVGSLLAADAQKDAFRADAKNLRLRAKEIKRKNIIQTALTRRRKVSLVAEQQTAFVASGVSMASGASTKMAEHTHDVMEEQIEIQTRQAEWEASMAMSEARSLEKQAKKAWLGGALGVVGAGLGLAKSLSK